jgi:hypothetical protein
VRSSSELDSRLARFNLELIDAKSVWGPSFFNHVSARLHEDAFSVALCCVWGDIKLESASCIAPRFCASASELASARQRGELMHFSHWCT